MSLFRDEQGNLVRATVPPWVKKQAVMTERKLTKEQHREIHAPVLIQNNKCTYVFVPRYRADEMIDGNQAIEITKDDPDYPKAWKLAVGYPKKSGGQINGEFVSYATMLTSDHDAEYQAILEMEKSPKVKVSESNGQTNSGILVPVGVNTDALPAMRRRGRPPKVLIPAKK